MKYFSVIVLFVLCKLSAMAQLPSLQWVAGFDEYLIDYVGGTGNGRSVGVDGKGNVYSVGYFSYHIDFDPGPDNFVMTAQGQSNQAIYICKLDAAGGFVWAKQIPTYVEFGQIELKVDPAGNIYVVSDLREPADMDPGNGVFMMKPTGFRDAFIVKLDTDGNLVWAKQFGGPGDTGPQGYNLALDPENNIIFCGTFNNTVDFDPGPGVFNLTSSAHTQAFLVKLNPQGNLIWAKQFGNGSEFFSSSTIRSLICDKQGNIVLTGSFAGTCDFDPGPGVFSATSSAGSSNDGFVCKLGGNGVFQWVKTYGQTGGINHFNYPMGIVEDKSGNLLVTGYFLGNFNFNPGAGAWREAFNQPDCFILKLDAQGNFKWVKIIGGDEQDGGNDIVVDEFGEVYIAGSFGPVVDFDPGPGTFIINSPHFGPETIVKLSADGDFIYAAPFQSIDDGFGLFRRMVMDPARNIYVTGYVFGGMDFDPGFGVIPFEGRGAFVLKLGPCKNATDTTLNVRVCNSYILNEQLYDSSGTYYQQFINASGCDSLITLNLIIQKQQTTQEITICEGGSLFAGGGTQTVSGIYFDTLKAVSGCDSIIQTNLTVHPKPLPVLGEDRGICSNESITLTPGNYARYRWQDNSTSATFTAQQAGKYWVQVTNEFDCTAADTMQITNVWQAPANFLTASDSLCSYSELVLTPTATFESYRWSSGSTLNEITVRNLGVYQLAVVDANGCKGTDSVRIYAKACMQGVYIPNAFTPDKNGLNDRFKPLIFGKLVQYRFFIFDRWGNVLFQANDPQLSWDGTHHGKPQKADSYIWKCAYQLEGQEPKTEKGTVTLIR